MYNIIKKGIKKGSDNMAKATDMAIPLYPKALENADYVVLTTLLDKKWSTYDTKNKPNFRKINRCDYLANKEEMIKATGDLDSIPILGEKPKKPLSKSQWDKSFKKLRELGIVEELKNTNNKLYAYRIYNKNEVGKEYTLVEAEIIRALRRTYKSTPIKAYAYLRSQCWDNNSKKFVRRKISLVNICKALGLSEDTRNDLFKLLQELHASRYITIYEKVKQSNQGDYNISYYEYEIVSYEEWKKARKPIRL